MTASTSQCMGKVPADTQIGLGAHPVPKNLSVHQKLSG